MLGWRPRDLDLGYLPFALGDGIAQYTSDPVFRRPAGADGQHRSDRQRPTVRQIPAPGPVAGQDVGAMPRADGSPTWPSPRAAVQTFPGDLFPALADLGGPAVAAVDDVLADRAEGHSACRRRPARDRRRGGRDHRLHPRRAPGRRWARVAGQPARRGRCGRRRDPGADGFRDPRRRGRAQGRGARCAARSASAGRTRWRSAWPGGRASARCSATSSPSSI